MKYLFIISTFNIDSNNHFSPSTIMVEIECELERLTKIKKQLEINRNYPNALLDLLLEKLSREELKKKSTELRKVEHLIKHCNALAAEIFSLEEFQSLTITIK